MKILYNIAGTFRSGGMERVLANKANWLVSNAYDVVIVTTDQKNRTPFFPFDSRIKHYDLGINYEDNNGSTLFNKICNFPSKQRKHKRRLLELLNKERPDVTVSMFCNDVNFIYRLNDGSRKVLEIHFSKLKRLQYDRKGLWGLIDKLLTYSDEIKVRKFDKFIVLTEEDKCYWGDIHNISVIPNALTFENNLMSSLEETKVIAVGRLTHQKGFDRLIKAWAIVHKVCPEWSLDIIGEGNEKEALQRLIMEEGLEATVKILPPINDISQAYLNASLLAMTSRYEGFGLVLTEAHSYGVPTVAFNCKCGPSDIITDGVDGFLVEEGDIEGLAEKILVLIKNEDLRKKMGAAAYKSSRRYSEEVIMSKWVELFDNVVKEWRRN